jgi:hypothetical protein
VSAPEDGEGSPGVVSGVGVGGGVVAVPVSAGVLRGTGMGVEIGIAGAEVSGWIGMGGGWERSGTGVALGPGDAGTGESCFCLQAGREVHMKAEARTARMSKRTFFMRLQPPPINV